MRVTRGSKLASLPTSSIQSHGEAIVAIGDMLINRPSALVQNSVHCGVRQANLWTYWRKNCLKNIRAHTRCNACVVTLFVCDKMENPLSLLEFGKTRKNLSFCHLIANNNHSE